MGAPIAGRGSVPITKDEIAWVYRLLLGREAAADEVDRWMGLSSVDDLRRLAFESVEFRGIMATQGAEMPALPPPLPPPA